MADINRRNFTVGVGAVGLSNIAPLRALTATWQDDSRTMRGLNIFQPFGWVIARQGIYPFYPYVNGGTFGEIMPRERRALIRSIGLDFVRVMVDFGPLLSAADDATFNSLVDEIMNGVTLYLDSGLKVLIVHFPPADSTLWPTVTDGVGGLAFKRMVEVWQRFATIIALRTQPAQVAVELFNEPPNPRDIKTDPWPVQQKFLFERVRAVLPAHAIFVTGDSFSAIDRLILLNPLDYDSNTFFKFGGYDPYVLSHQGADYCKYVHRLTFPPQEHPGGKESAIAEFVAAVNADESMSLLAKTLTIIKFTRRQSDEGLDTYFDKPCDANFIAARIKTVTDWAATNGLSTRRLVVGEFGARGDFERMRTDGTLTTVHAGTSTTQVKFYEAWRVKAEAARLGAWCAHEISGPTGWSIALDKPPWTFRPDLVAALGLKS